MIMTPIGQMIGQHMNPITDMMEITPKAGWYNLSYYASVEELTLSEDKHSESFAIISEDGQTDQNNRFRFSAICEISDTNLWKP